MDSFACNVIQKGLKTQTDTVKSDLKIFSWSNEMS